MDNANLILGDSLFALGLLLVIATNGIRDYGIILVPLLVVAFASCVVRHINYYNETGRYF
ncbi:hypothetical protein [Mucilaginibacter sp. dw_454]|uniref:hypothetical protein n=1 Tax=Mucilaginibacter sp. dw_454 TaxID=2720079 RepID=UPI001BD44B6D|nr:hypothetical protein [Mucilaginibacter sp. dw_454]